MASSNSSKTAHVMNLLSKNRGSTPVVEPETPPVEADASTEKIEKMVQEAPVEKTEESKKTVPVAPIIASINADAAVSSQIKDALEAELLEPHAAPAEVAAPIAPAETAAPAVPAEQPLAEHAPLSPSAEELMDLPPMKPAAVAAVAECIPAEECYVNVMQLLVEEKAEKYMQMFGVCCCERCQLDVKAFALNHLPPKYVFMGPDERVPRLTVYESQYSSDITAQLLKACTIVHETPHHGRPNL